MNVGVAASLVLVGVKVAVGLAGWPVAVGVALAPPGVSLGEMVAVAVGAPGVLVNNVPVGVDVGVAVGGVVVAVKQES